MARTPDLGVHTAVLLATFHNQEHGGVTAQGSELALCGVAVFDRACAMVPPFWHQTCLTVMESFSTVLAST
jgi:hypothetical protein